MWFTHKHRAPDPCMQIQQYSLVELCAYGVLAEKSVFGMECEADGGGG